MFRKALELYEALGDREGIARQYGNLGNGYWKRDELEQAEAMFRKALALFQKIGAAPDVGQVQKILRTLHEEGALDC